MTLDQFPETQPWALDRQRRQAWGRVAKRMIVFGLLSAALAIIALASWSGLFL